MNPDVLRYLRCPICSTALTMPTAPTPPTATAGAGAAGVGAVTGAGPAARAGAVTGAGPAAGARAGAAALRCESGHSFDIARQGYVNLLAGRATHAGDTAQMVAARADFLAAGHYEFITTALAAAARSAYPSAYPQERTGSVPGPPAPSARGPDRALPGATGRNLVVDAGAGTGHHLAAVLNALSGSHPTGTRPAGSGLARSGPVGSGPVGSGPVGSGPVGSGPVGSGPVGSGPVGSGLASGHPDGTASNDPHGAEAVGLALDVAKPALRRAARAHHRAAAVLCDTWHRLPLADAAACLVLDVFAPRNGAEFHRILRPDGTLLVVTPTAAHLAELVGPLGLLSVDGAKRERIAAGLARWFTAASEQRLDRTLLLTHAEVRTLVEMGPSAWHTNPATLAARISTLPEPVPVTASVHLRHYHPCAP